MAVLLLIMTFVPAMSVTVSAAANIEGRLITVGGKTVNSGMKIAEVEKLFGKPKLTTPSYWGGYAYMSDGTLWEGQIALYFRWTCLPDCAVPELDADYRRNNRRLS